MSLSIIKTYVENERVLFTQLNAIQTELIKAPDMSSGSTDTKTGFDLTLQGRMRMDGSGGILSFRFDDASMADANSNISNAYDVYLLDATLTAARQYTLAHTSPAAAAGDRVRVVRSSTDAFEVQVRREDATVLVEMPSSETCWAEFMFDGTDWRTIDWASNVNSVTI